MLVLTTRIYSHLLRYLSFIHTQRDCITTFIRTQSFRLPLLLLFFPLQCFQDITSIIMLSYQDVVPFWIFVLAMKITYNLYLSLSQVGIDTRLFHCCSVRKRDGLMNRSGRC